MSALIHTALEVESFCQTRGWRFCFIGGLPFEEDMFNRASAFEIERGRFITTASAEDIVILKAFASRDKDWSDVRGILSRQRGKLDRGLIFRELKVLVELKEEPEILNKLTQYFDR